MNEDDDGYITIATHDEFAKWCVEAGWDTVQQFERETHTRVDDLIGKPFTVMRNSVYIKE